MDKAIGRVSPVPRFALRHLRFIPLAFGAVALIFGLLTGLARIGIALPEPAATLAEFHGALMISGFLGTLISLERAVAFRRWWAYGAPAISALGAAALLMGAAQFAMLCFALASALMTAATVRILVRQPTLPTLVLCIAAAAWGAGTLLWLTGHSMSDVVGWWLTFLILTIAAERLELSRLINPPPVSQALFGAIIALLMAGAAFGEFGRPFAPFTGFGLIGCAAWLLRYDIARHVIRQRGQTRFSATCMIAGHAWLAICGLLLLVAPAAAAFSQDAAIHAIAIGFVLSMVFGHAPTILPAVTGLRIKFSPFAYGALALLHLSLILRIGADLFAFVDARAVSGLVTLLALVTYVATLVIASRGQVKM